MQGLNGYLDIYYHTPLSEKVHIFLNASKELGYRNVNVLGKDEIGSSPTPFSIRWGRRLSSAEAYLSPAKTRKNLTVLPRSFVTKIFLSIKFKKAIGVQFSVNNTLYSVQAGKEVVLTAGVVGTPKLLMLSGIGKEEQLKKVKIKVKQNLQVGTKLRNHFYLRNISYVTSISEPFFTLSDSIKQYLSTVGPLTISDNKQGLLLTKLAQSEGDVPEVEITFSPSSNSLGFDSEQPNPKNDIFHFALKLLNTSTEGNITLRSNDPFDYPIINDPCLADPNDEDIAKAYEGVRLILKFAESDTFKKLSPTPIAYPPCLNNEFMSKDYWFCVLRRLGKNAYDGLGTCRMGPDRSKGAVVDNKLKVYGVKRLRIADNSVVPVGISGNPSSVAMMIGERAAEFIKQDYK